MSSDNTIGAQHLGVVDTALHSANTIKSITATTSNPRLQDDRQALPHATASGDTKTAILNADKGEASTEEVTKAVANLSEIMQKFGHVVEFSVDEETNKTIILVKDEGTQEVVRQIPSEEAVELSKRLAEPTMVNQQGLSPVTTSFLVDEEL